MAHILKQGDLWCFSSNWLGRKSWKKAYGIASVIEEPFFQIYKDSTCSALIHTIRLKTCAPDVRFGRSSTAKYCIPVGKGKDQRIVIENLLAFNISNTKLKKRKGSKKNLAEGETLWLCAMSLPERNDWIMALGWTLQGKVSVTQNNQESSNLSKYKTLNRSMCSLNVMEGDEEPDWVTYWREFMKQDGDSTVMEEPWIKPPGDSSSDTSDTDSENECKHAKTKHTKKKSKLATGNKQGKIVTPAESPDTMNKPTPVPRLRKKAVVQDVSSTTHDNKKHNENTEILHGKQDIGRL